MTDKAGPLGFSRADPRVRALNDRAVATPADFVLYWMQAYRRADDNAALAHALGRANELGLPCLVYESLSPDAPFASDRFHTFVLESAVDVARGLAARGVAYAFFLPRERADARRVLCALVARAALVVTDDCLSGSVPQDSAELAREAACPVLAIDDSAVVPLALFPKEESAARTLRPKMMRLLDAWLRPLAEPLPSVPAPSRLDLPFDPIRLTAPSLDLKALVGACPIDHSVGAVPDLPGGSRAAEERARSFMQRGLRAYAEERNDPGRRGTSGLSPYLAHGTISARRVALLARDAGRDLGATDASDAFLEQLLVRRGLAHNFARMNPQHRDYDGLPSWARKTLAAHAMDARPGLLTLEELTDACSPDPLWNAAQLELRASGVIHGYARMLWGKLPLLWTREPRDAHAALVALNDRFALDGRGPDGYAGIGWCFGLHDRPWPGRPVYGTVRTMTSKSARSKLDFEGYIDGAGARRDELGLRAP